MTKTQNTFGFNFDNSYKTLPGAFYAPAKPADVANPELIILNQKLGESLGLDFSRASNAEIAAIFSGKNLPEGAEPIAQAYAGHQFGHFTMLGDGRAILWGEQLAPDGRRYDLQFKGSGQTPFSRRGDGKAALGPMLREYIIGEALHALGLPTTRSLAVVATGDSVYREEVLPGAILTRVATSHIRVGTFEFAIAYGSAGVGARMDAVNAPTAHLKALADYAIRRHYPECIVKENPYLAFFEAVADAQAKLVAQWQLIGFVHGVMNTDNMSIAGESIDFGPCAFMDTFDPATVFSSIDQHGRYAYGNQPRIASWNLARLAETLLSLFAEDEQEAIELGQAAIKKFHARFNHYWLSGMRAKLGLNEEQADDADFVTSLLALMHKNRADYTNSLRRLSQGDSALAEEHLFPGTKELFADSQFQIWREQWRGRLKEQGVAPGEAAEKMRRVNPAVIARNHKVEEALAAAVQSADLKPLQALLALLADPFSDSGDPAYRTPAPPSALPYRTFCGT